MSGTKTKTPTQARSKVQIIEVEPDNGVVHCIDKTHGTFKASFGDNPGLLLVPSVGENWNAQRVGYTWKLVSRIDSTTGTNQGDAVVNADGNFAVTAASATFNSLPFGAFDTSLANTTVSGITAIFTAGHNLNLYDLCYIKSDGNMWQANATAIATAPVIALASTAITAGSTGIFLLHGIARNDTGYTWTTGGLVFLSTTAGLPTQTAPSATNNVIQVVGVALAANLLYLNPSLVMVEHV